MFKPVFIVGLPRTGSTLWSNVIANNECIMRFGEMHFLNPIHRDFRYFLKRNVGDLEHDYNVEKLTELLFSGKKFDGLRGNYWSQMQRIEPDKLKKRIYTRLIDSPRSLEDIFVILVTECTKIRGFESCLVKFPVYATYIHLLMKWMPEARVIHISRDPRATAISKTRDPGGTAKRIEKFPYLRNYFEFTSKWSVVAQYIATSYAHSKNKHNVNYALYRYEDLLLQPEVTIRDLCRFLQIDYVDEMLFPKEGQPSSVTGEKCSGFDSSNLNQWKKRLPAWQADIIRLITSRAMSRLGYSPEHYESGFE